MNPMATPQLGGNELAYLTECVASTFVSSVGPFVDRFEAEIATVSEGVFAVATSSGTTALHAALLAVGVKPGDLVVMPTLTFIATANAVAHCHAQPWIFDVSAQSWALDPDLLADALEQQCGKGANGRPVHLETGKRVSAVMPVYAMGVPADMDRIVSTCSR